jgi:LPS export ABC transporter protein LptC
MKAQRLELNNFLIPQAKIIQVFIPMVISIGILFSGCANDPQELQALAAKRKQLPAETAREIEILYSENGRTKIKLNAPLLDRFVGDDPYLEFPEGVHVIFFDTLMNPETSLKANYAINREAEKIMEARSNVIVINEKGEILNTEHLIWDQKNEKIHTKEFVKITTADEIIMGEGMEADQQFTKYKINKIRGTINIRDNEDHQNP